MNSITTTQPDHHIHQPTTPSAEYDLRWLNFFDPYRALEDVSAHIAALPSSANPEKHTARAYSDGIRTFIEWGYALIHNTPPGTDEIIHPLPDKPLITRFIAYLRATGRGASTIASKYLAPLRHYLRALHQQNNNMPKNIEDLMFWTFCKEQFRASERIPSPRLEKKSNLSPFYTHGIRFSIKQANATLRQIDRSTRAGLRDYAIIHLGFNTGLRVAELRRITRANFECEGDQWLIKDLRGKRNNYDPIPVYVDVVNAIDAYIKQWNIGLEPDDPRLITHKSPLWHPLKSNDGYLAAHRYDPTTSISPRALANIIAKRTKHATGIALAPHDLRRTMTAIAEDSGMGRQEIRRITRHQSVSQLDAYIGDKPDWAKSTLGLYVRLG